jgi:dolichyl-phosphate beta-glucosyltransferase
LPEQGPFLSIVLPAYNEARSIQKTLTAMRTFLDQQGYAYEVIVAADGDDSTAEIVRDVARNWPSLELSDAPGRRGKGHGLRRGFAIARGDVVGFLDADYKTPIEEMPRLLPWLERGYEIAIGSRALSESRIERHQPWFRRIGSRVFAIGMHLIVGLHDVRDTQCGFKFFSRRAAKAIFSVAKIDGYMCDVEILWLAQRLGLPVREVGISWRDDGDSRLELLRGNLRNIAELLRIRFGRYALAQTEQTLSATRPLSEVS